MRMKDAQLFLRSQIHDYIGRTIRGSLYVINSSRSSDLHCLFRISAGDSCNHQQTCWVVEAAIRNATGSNQNQIVSKNGSSEGVTLAFIFDCHVIFAITSYSFKIAKNQKQHQRQRNEQRLDCHVKTKFTTKQRTKNTETNRWVSRWF